MFKLVNTLYDHDVHMRCTVDYHSLAVLCTSSAPHMQVYVNFSADFTVCDSISWKLDLQVRNAVTISLQSSTTPDPGYHMGK